MNLGKHNFYGHGKLLLTGEYLVLDGAKSIALPTNFGQAMQVSYRRSNAPKLFWKCFDKNTDKWFEATFELWHFDLLSDPSETSNHLQKILRQARIQNVHFLRDNVDVHVDSHLEFNLDWGLGSSSTLIYNIAQWAYISAFELNRKVSDGSGYDVACAQAVGPIYYQLKNNGSNWGTLNFNPLFKNGLYFIHLNKKQDTAKQITWFKDKVGKTSAPIINRISKISDDIINCYDLCEFEDNLLEHEQIIKSITGMQRIQETLFSDFPGVIKSLGAWGGDFVLATSSWEAGEVKKYFAAKGFETILSYDEMIFQKDPAADISRGINLLEGAVAH